MPTNNFECNDAEWVKVTDGATAAIMQLGTNGPVVVRKQIADPNPSETGGIVLQRSTGMAEIAFDALNGESLFIRGRDADTEKVVVIT